MLQKMMKEGGNAFENFAIQESGASLIEAIHLGGEDGQDAAQAMFVHGYVCATIELVSAFARSGSTHLLRAFKSVTWHLPQEIMTAFLPKLENDRWPMTLPLILAISKEGRITFAVGFAILAPINKPEPELFAAADTPLATETLVEESIHWWSGPPANVLDEAIHHGPLENVVGWMPALDLAKTLNFKV
jgi:hypothetical protein